MQRAKLFAYVNSIQDDIERILQDKQFHLRLKSEQKEIIQNMLDRKDSFGSVIHGLRKEHVLRSPLFWTRSDHICKSSPMIHCGNRSFLEVT